MGGLNNDVFTLGIFRFSFLAWCCLRYYDLYIRVGNNPLQTVLRLEVTAALASRTIN